MRINLFVRTVGVVLIPVLSMACMKRPQAEVPVPTPAPTSAPPSAHPTPPIPAPGTTVLRQHISENAGGPWTFTYTPATLTYDIMTEGTVAMLPDSTNLRALASVTQRVTFAVAADGSVQLIDPPVPTGPVCDSIAVLAGRTTQLLPKLPSQLTAGLTWSDSATVDNCVGNAFANTVLAHTYTVMGDTVFNGTKVLHIVRSSVMTAKGEGSEGQHRVLLTTSGTGTTDLYFDVTAGRFLGSLGTQTSLIDVTTSGRLSHFLQQATERVTFVRAQ